MLTQEAFDLEFEEIAQSLDRINGVFCQLFELSKPVLTEEIPTAAVGFDKHAACVSFEINPVFWSNLNRETKIFLICHECMHVILQHGKRSQQFLGINKEGDPLDDADPTTQLEAGLSNIAMDIVINEAIVKHFGISRTMLNFAEAVDSIHEHYNDALGEDIPEPIDESVLPAGKVLPNIKEGSFMDTVFNDIDPDIEHGKSYEYYLDVLVDYYKEMIQESKDTQKAFQELIKHIRDNGIDSHEKLGEMRGGGSDPSDDAGGSEHDGKDSGGNTPSEMVVQEAMEGADADDLEKLGDALETSFGKGYPGEPLIAAVLKNVMKLSYRDVKKQRKWQSLFRGHIKHVQEDAEDYQWVKKDRRNAIMPPSFLLPSRNDTEAKDDKWKVWLYIDSSGSCHHLQKQFLKAAYSIDLRYFDVRLFARSTRVEEMDYHSPVMGGGGSDDFRCIENHIQHELKSGKISRYPEIVMHFTDGYDCSGTMVQPEKPKNWWWFLTDDGTREWIPRTCVDTHHVFKLSEFE